MSVGGEVPIDRYKEIERYLRLFGYKPERTVLQVHLAGSFGRRPPGARALSRRKEYAARYRGRTFTVVGSSHDPELLQHLLKPRGKVGVDSNPGYLGYLFAGKDEGGKPPHELLPLDFVPSGMVYPSDWKSRFNGPGYLITMHVPASLAPYKNELLRKLRRIAGTMDVKKRWTFFNELEEFGFGARSEEEQQQELAMGKGERRP